MRDAGKLGAAVVVVGLIASAGDDVLAEPAGDAALGRDKAAICVTCHGADGLSIGPNIPNLRGQRPEYFVNALKSYKKRDRRDPVSVIMYPFADDLSEQDMRDLAAFYASLADDCSGEAP